MNLPTKNAFTFPDLAGALAAAGYILWGYAKIAVLGVLFFWLPAFFVNAMTGLDWFIQFTAPLGDDIGPAKLWWMIVPAALVSIANLRSMGERTLFDENGNLEGILMFGAGFFLFWLWVHDAYALLWPALAFTVAHSLASGARVAHTVAITGGALTTTPVSSPVFPPKAGEAAPRQYAYPARNARYTFADVDGMDPVKRELLAFGKEALVTDQEAVKTRKTNPGKSYRNGALLFGAPGNGKTFMAEALAGSLGVRFITVSFAEIASKWVNDTTERIVLAFTEAAAQAPCVLLVDEIDSVLADRAAMSDPGSEGPKMVNALLTKLVETRGRGVVIMAATNYPDKLDAAGKREGRFDVKIEIPAPDQDARLGILRRGIGHAERIFPGALEMAARHFAGFSVARLLAVASIVRDRLDGDNTRQEVRFTSLLHALRKVQGVNHAALREGVPSLDDIVLKPSAKSEILRLAGMMREIERTEAEGAAIQPGAVFYGPPGTGKTLTAKALAKATGWSFIPTTGQDLVRRDDAMDKVIAQASDERPAIVFIDEADDILADRNYSSHTKMATNKLLTLLDGAGGRIPDVLFIAATNNPSLFDAASRRRFPIKIEFALPGAQEIEDYVAKWMEGLSIPVGENFTLERAVKMLEGKSIADIRVALQEAINIAVSYRADGAKRGLRLGDLERAVRSLSFG